MKVESHLRDYLFEKNEPSQKHLKTLLKPFLRYLRDEGVGLDEFDQKEVLDFIRDGAYQKYTERKDELSNTTLRQIYNSIINLLKWQMDNAESRDEEWKINKRLLRVQKCDLNLSEVQRVGEERKWLTLKEMGELLSFAKQSSGEDFSIFYLLGYFGCRIGELFDKYGNRVEIDFGENKFVILTAKSDPPFERVNYFDDRTARIFKNALDKGWLEEPVPYWRWDKYKERLDLLEDSEAEFTPHKLRNTANHWFKKKFGKDFLVNLILGWKIGESRKDMSQYYDSATLEEIRELMLNKHYYDDIDFSKPTFRQ